MDFFGGLADGLVESFLRPFLVKYTQQFVKPGGITQEEANVAVAGDMVDVKIGLIAYLDGQKSKGAA